MCRMSVGISGNGHAGSGLIAIGVAHEDRERDRGNSFVTGLNPSREANASDAQLRGLFERNGARI